jgi:AbrB family looped-hinge helix DNA binding protein
MLLPMPTTITEKGQVVIPVGLRRRLGLVAGRKVRFVPHSTDLDALVVKPVADFASFRGSFKTNKKYSKKLARKVFVAELIKKNI